MNTSKHTEIKSNENKTTMLVTRLTDTRLNKGTAKHYLISLSSAVLALSLATFSQISLAKQDKAFVDSVHGWGSWDLGLEPAAGGPVIPNNTVVRVDQRNVQFRPNDNSAFAGSKQAVTVGENPTPIAPPLSPPTSGPLAPGNIPVGGPGDRF